MKRSTQRVRRSSPSAEPKPGARGRAARAPFDPRSALVEAFLTNERINQVLLDLLDPSVWRLTPPCSQRRNIATTFSHIHNVRCMYVRSTGSKTPLTNLERTTVTPDEARKALAASALAVAQVIESAFENGGKVRGVPVDAAGFVCSAITHEAHHRGQICHWARELGAPIQDQIQLWEWHKRQREIVRS